MTLILAFPAQDGAALLADTRKWLPNGGYVDAHQKLIRCWDGLVTGSGSGDLLDFVAEHSARRLGIEVLMLIDPTTAIACEGDYAEWTLSVERRSASDPMGKKGVGFQVFDGHRLRPDSWVPGNVPVIYQNDWSTLELRNQSAPGRAVVPRGDPASCRRTIS